MPVVDASVWVAFYHPRDPAHQQAFAWVNAALGDGRRLLGPTLVLAEVGAAIARQSHRDDAASALEHLTSRVGLDLVVLDEARARRAAEVAAVTGVRTADSIYLELAQERGDVLITLDRQQLERGSRVVDVREP